MCSQVQVELRARTQQDWPKVAHMMVPVDEGNFLSWLVGTLGVRRAIELGTFTGYSALAVAQVTHQLLSLLSAFPQSMACATNTGGESMSGNIRVNKTSTGNEVI